MINYSLVIISTKLQLHQRPEGKGLVMGEGIVMGETHILKLSTYSAAKLYYHLQEHSNHPLEGLKLKRKHHASSAAFLRSHLRVGGYICICYCLPTCITCLLYFLSVP